MQITTNTKKVSAGRRTKTEVKIAFEKGDAAYLTKAGGTQTLSIGVGEKLPVSAHAFPKVLRRAIQTAKSYKFKQVMVPLSELRTLRPDAEDADLAESMARNAIMANFAFTTYKTPPKGGFPEIKKMTITEASGRDIRDAVSRGVVVGEEINETRVLANTPGGEMTPRLLAGAAQKTAKRTGLKATILKEADIKKQKMGGVLGVSQGSSEPPRFIILEHKPAPQALRQTGKQGEKNEGPIVLVGKGITFDTGGINLKPTQAINDMHMDMAGGAAVMQALAVAARLNIKKHIIGIIPAAENMPSGTSYRPHDVITSLSGKTIEIGNTDAEGRVVLADALTYAARYKPRLITTVATLTGASLVALGQRASALFSTDAELEARIRAWGEKSDEYVWPLPLWDDYKEDIEGMFGDVSNTGKTPYGGTITAAKFLQEFVADTDAWAHLDIAPRMTAIEGDYLAKGATGTPVALLAELMREY